MATITCCTSTASVARPAALVQKGLTVRPLSNLGLRPMSRMGKLRCCSSSKEENAREERSESKLSMGGACLMACGAAAMFSPVAMALVDERMSTEGTGLPFGLSNNLLGWLLLGVFALIWALYFVYTSGLEEDEESGGLSL